MSGHAKRWAMAYSLPQGWESPDYSAAEVLECRVMDDWFLLPGKKKSCITSVQPDEANLDGR